MREIKLRAWIRVEKRFDYSGDLRDYDYARRYFNSLEDNDIDDGDVILMQYTGLKDKNGKEIYEGDIVRVEYLNYPESDKEKLMDTYVSPITFRNGFFAFSDGYEYRVPCQGCLRTEVIGNIHENPDLLRTG